MMSFECLKVSRWLSQVGSGALPGDLRRHVETCASCRQRLGREQAVAAELSLLPQDRTRPSAHSHQRLMATLRARSDLRHDAPRPTASWRDRIGLMPAAAVGAALALVLVVSLSETELTDEPQGLDQGISATAGLVDTRVNPLGDLQRHLSVLDKSANPMPEAALRAEMARLQADLGKLGLVRAAVIPAADSGT